MASPKGLPQEDVFICELTSMFESFGHQVVENSREWASQWTQGLNHNLKRQQLAVSDL